MITPERIQELATRPNVSKTAVENFLVSLGDLDYQEALGNLEMDARSYRWSLETQAAIRQGLLNHYYP